MIRQSVFFQMAIVFILIAEGAISHAPPMIQVAHNRQERPVKYIRYLPENLDLSACECLIAVSYKANYLVGRKAVFISDDGIVSGRWLIVDYEEPWHAGILKRKGLAADLACHDKTLEEFWIHKKGKLYLIGENGVH